MTDCMSNQPVLANASIVGRQNESVNRAAILSSEQDQAGGGGRGV